MTQTLKNNIHKFFIALAIVAITHVIQYFLINNAKVMAPGVAYPVAFLLA